MPGLVAKSEGAGTLDVHRVGQVTLIYYVTDVPWNRSDLMGYIVLEAIFQETSDTLVDAVLQFIQREISGS